MKAEEAIRFSLLCQEEWPEPGSDERGSSAMRVAAAVV